MNLMYDSKSKGREKNENNIFYRKEILHYIYFIIF